MIALPFHPSNAYPIREFKANAGRPAPARWTWTRPSSSGIKNAPASLTGKIVDGQFRVDQGVIAGCSGGTWQNLVRAAEILEGHSIGDGAFWLCRSIPASHAHHTWISPSRASCADLIGRRGLRSLLLLRPLLRRRGCARQRRPSPSATPPGTSPTGRAASPGNGQIAYVALMDARSIAATALNGGRLTAADRAGFRLP